MAEPTSDVIIPEKFLGLTPGPNLDTHQFLVTLSVQLKDGSILRVAFPEIAVTMFDNGRRD